MQLTSPFFSWRFRVLASWRLIFWALILAGLVLDGPAAGPAQAQPSTCDPAAYGRILREEIPAQADLSKKQHPIVLVHGFNSSADTWGDEADANSLYGRLIQKYDKSLIHRLSYPPGPDGRPNGVADVTCTARYLMEAVNILSEIDHQRGGSGKVDIVAHSLGGLVTRQLLVYRDTAGPNQTQYNGNIGRFIDLSTPHRGSEYINLYNQGADAVADGLTKLVLNKIAKPVIRSFIKDLVNKLTQEVSLIPKPESPAGQQLDPDSAFIKTLNQHAGPTDIDYYLLYSDIGFNVTTKYFDAPVASGQVASVGDMVVSKDNATTIPQLGSRTGANPPNYQLFGFDAEITLRFEAELNKPEIKLDNKDQFLAQAQALFHTNIYKNDKVKQKVLELLENDYVAVNRPPLLPPSVEPPVVISPPIVPVIDLQPVEVGHTATALVFDISDSMKDTEPGGARKIDAAIKAGGDILNLISTENELSPGAHQVGVASFSNSAAMNQPLNSDLETARQIIGQLAPQQNTNMAAGLDTGIDLLANVPADTDRILLLLSDGQPTTSNANPQPMILFNQTEYLEDLKNEILNNQVPRAKAARVCIYTIGFGQPGPVNDSRMLDESFLQQIAAGSGCGHYYNAQNAFDLATVYLRSRHEALGKLIVQYNGKIKQDETIKLDTFQVASGAQQLNITLNWPGSKLALQLIDPQGRPVDATYPNAARREFGNMVYMVINHPVVGQWQASVLGVEVPHSVTDYNVLVSTRTFTPRSQFNPLYLIISAVVVGGILLLLYSRSAPAAARPPGRLPGVEVPGLGVVGFRRNLITIGRHPRDDVCLPQISVSRHHARLTRAGQEYILEDLHSSNGTLVNGQPIGRCVLKHGDQITVGDTTLTFRMY